MKRIARAGSFVEQGRVEGELALSRALGDFSLKFSHHAPTQPPRTATLPVAAQSSSDVKLTNGASPLPGKEAPVRVSDWWRTVLGKGPRPRSYSPVEGAVCALADVHIGHVPTESEALAVIACDGVWDVMSSAQAVNLASAALGGLAPRGSPSSNGSASKPAAEITEINPATALVVEAYRRDSLDNLSCVVLRIPPSSCAAATAPKPTTPSRAAPSPLLG
jgi:serine/threonine protein phosphatase PrpC